MYWTGIKTAYPFSDLFLSTLELSLHSPFGIETSLTFGRRHQQLCELSYAAFYILSNTRTNIAMSCLLRLVSVVGFLDSVVAAKQNSARFGYSISPNRELVALGAGNLVGSFVPGTLPAYGSITR
jgi:MFS superfamily sulfate permease-like transporter